MNAADEVQLAKIEAELEPLTARVKALWAERKIIKDREKAKIDQAAKAERALRDHEYAQQDLSYDKLSDRALSIYAEQTSGDPHQKTQATADALPKGIGLKRTRQMLIHGAFRVFRIEDGVAISAKLILAAIRVNQDFGIWQLAPTIDLTDKDEWYVSAFTKAFNQAGYTVNFAPAEAHSP